MEITQKQLLEAREMMKNMMRLILASQPYGETIIINALAEVEREVISLAS